MPFALSLVQHRWQYFFVSHVNNDVVAYFESKNILVKVDGSDPEFLQSGGVLFSAHLDSVSTSVGATDDGMGVVTLLSDILLKQSSEENCGGQY